MAAIVKKLSQSVLVTPRASTTFILEPVVSITTPASNTFIQGVSLTVTGTASCTRITISQNGDEQSTDAIDSIDSVEVRLGAGSFKLATAQGPVNTNNKKRWSSWTCAFPEITGNAGNTLHLTARVTAGMFSSEHVVTVVVDRTPPLLVITKPQDGETILDTTSLKIEGTVQDEKSGVDKVEWALDGQATFTLATLAAGANTVLRNWNATITPLPAVGEHTIQVRATDKEKNVTLTQIAVDIPGAFTPKDPANVFGVAAYLDDLFLFAKNRLRIGTTSPLKQVQPLDLENAFHQPFTLLTDPTKRQLATAAVSQVRLGIEVLRIYLQAKTVAIPSSVEQRYRKTAYEALLRGTGASSEEIRLARVAAPARRQALADRPRPSR
jgi:hypothetical protein